MILHTGKVLYTTTAHEHNGVLLEVVAFTRDVGNDLNPIGQADLGNFYAESRVRLLRRGGVDTGADAATLRACSQRARLGLFDLRLASFANQLLDRWHVDYRLFSISFLGFGAGHKMGVIRIVSASQYKDSYHMHIPLL